MTDQIKPTRKHVNQIFEWCIKQYGKSKFNKTVPVVEFKKPDYYTEGCMAFYDEIDSTIYINKDQNDNLPELVNSVIHEYVHYKQNMKHYQILSMYLSDSKNPMEIEANKIAKRDTKKCLKEIFNITTSK
jgi:ferritin